MTNLTSLIKLIIFSVLAGIALMYIAMDLVRTAMWFLMYHWVGIAVLIALVILYAACRLYSNRIDTH